MLLALVGAAMAWLGVTLQSGAAERRGGAMGLAIAGLGLALATAAGGRSPLSAAALAAGGVMAAVLRFRGGETPPQLLQSGSTPRLVAAIAIVAVVGVLGAPNLGTPAGVATLAGVTVALVAGGHVLTTSRSWAASTSASAVALALGALGGIEVTLAGAVTAVALGLIEPIEAVGARTRE